MTDVTKTNSTDDVFANLFQSSSSEKKEKTAEVIPKEVKVEAEVKVKEETPSVEETEDINPKEKQTKDDTNENLQSLKKQLQDAKSWGHKKNASYVHAKRKVTDFLSKLQEDALVNEEDVVSILQAFDGANTEEESPTPNNKYKAIKEALDKEFLIFKKYNKSDNLEQKYESFFSFFPLLSSQEQERILDYMMNENTDIVVDHIINTGTDIYDTLYKGAEKHGGLVPYVKFLQAQIEKTEKKNIDLSRELDITEKTIYTNNIDSKVLNPVQSSKKVDFKDIWQG